VPYFIGLAADLMLKTDRKHAVNHICAGLGLNRRGKILLIGDALQFLVVSYFFTCYFGMPNSQYASRFSGIGSGLGNASKFAADSCDL
jgi:hypothetical protein